MYTAITQTQDINIEASSLLFRYKESTDKRSYQYNKLSTLLYRYQYFDHLHLEFVTGRGGAGFHSPGPARTTVRGGYFGGDPRPAPVRGESPLIPWMGPRFSPPVLTGSRLGNGRARGQGQGTVK